MKIAVISDIHDNIWSLDKVLKAIAGEGTEALVVCGDVCAPFSLRMIADSFSGPVHVVFGNNDGDQFLLSKIAAAAENVTLHGIYGEITFGTANIAIVHYPEIGRRLAASHAFAAVFYGHSHKAEMKQVDDCLALNPGEVMGRLGPASYAIFDADTREGQIKTI